MQSARVILYCHLWLLRLYHIFQHYLLNSKTFSLNIKCVLWLSNTIFFFRNTAPIKKNPVIYYHKCVKVFLSSTRHSCQILMKLEFSRQIFEQSSNAKFHENPSSGNRVVPSGQTDGRTDMTMHIVAFRNFASAPQIRYYIRHLIHELSRKQREAA